MGAYFWGPARNDFTWYIIVPHQEQFKADILSYTRDWRLVMHIERYTADRAGLVYTTAAAKYDREVFLFTIPIELRSGWIHLAHTYNPNESGGTLRSYMNGNVAFMRSNLALRVYGSQGAYVQHY